MTGNIANVLGIDGVNISSQTLDSYPYIRVLTIQNVQNSPIYGGDVLPQIDFFSDYSGSKEVDYMMEQASQLLLNSQISVDGYKVIFVRQIQAITFDSVSPKGAPIVQGLLECLFRVNQL